MITIKISKTPTGLKFTAGIINGFEACDIDNIQDFARAVAAIVQSTVNCHEHAGLRILVK